jgi:5-methylcytosine-specific restriction endonuclease McrA
MIYPLSAGRYRLEVTITTEAYEMLRRLQELMRHCFPTGDPAQIVMRSFATQLQRVERQQLADVTRPRTGLRVSHTRYVPAAVKRHVWRRDGFQCAFVGANGRCQERSFLQLHHVVPFAESGPTTAENLQLRCRAHNIYETELDSANRPDGETRHST